MNRASTFALLSASLLAACSGELGADPTHESFADAASDARGEATLELGADTGTVSREDVGVDSTPAQGDSAPAEDTAPVAVDTGPDESVKKVLSFTWKGQETYYWCGPGSARLALSTRLSSPPSQTTLAKYMGTTTAGTDYIGLVVNALNAYFPATHFRSKSMYDPPTAAQRAALKADILANIGDGYGMVANVISGWRPPGYPGGTIYHYVAIVGYDGGGERVLIADPAAEGAGGSSWSKVPRTYWISLHDLGTWIGGKGYTGR